MLLGAWVGAQAGVTAIKFIRGYKIRLLFAIMIIFTSFSGLTEQVYKMTRRQVFGNLSGLILVGTALAMTIIIISKLITESPKGRGRNLGIS